jgi:hypothetical protein
LVAERSWGFSQFRRIRSVTKKVFLLTILLLAALAAGCSAHNETANTNPNAATTTAPAPDNSEVTTATDASGTKTQTRVFRNNPRIARVVVTTRNGTRTVKAYSPSGEEREVKTDENVLEATGDTVAKAAGFVADKAEDVAGETKDAAKTVADKAEDVSSKAVDTSKNVGEKTVEGAKKVGEKTAEGAKTVGSKTVSGAKKVGSAVKKVIP